MQARELLLYVFKMLKFFYISEKEQLLKLSISEGVLKLSYSKPLLSLNVYIYGLSSLNNLRVLKGTTRLPFLCFKQHFQVLLAEM